MTKTLRQWHGCSPICRLTGLERRCLHDHRSEAFGFFSDGAAQPQLDAWWDLQIPRDAAVIFVVDDADGLEDWLLGIDGSSYVGVSSPERMRDVRTPCWSSWSSALARRSTMPPP